LLEQSTTQRWCDLHTTLTLGQLLHGWQKTTTNFAIKLEAMYNCTGKTKICSIRHNFFISHRKWV